MRGKRCAMSARFKSTLLTWTVPALSTVITSGGILLGGGGGLSFSSCLGRFSQKVLVISGVTTMKMMRITNATSTRGVTFTFGVAVLPDFLPKDIPMAI